MAIPGPRDDTGGPAEGPVSTLSPEAERLLALAVASEVRAAFRFVDGLLEAGWTPERVLSGLIVEVQREVGRRWARDRFSVADEHAATGVLDGLVGWLAWRARPEPTPAGGRIAVVCAEGDWHAMSARLIAESLRLRGWPVVLLGASVPAHHLGRQASQDRWSAAVVTCTVPMNLPGAARSIAALCDAGVPSLAAGLAFGTEGSRASAVGATGWAADVDAGTRVLHRWATSPPDLLGPVAHADREHLELAAARDDVVGQVMRGLASAVPTTRGYSADQRARTEEDVGYLLRFLEAAVLTRDVSVLTDYLDWLVMILTSRGVPASTIAPTLRLVQQAVPSHLRTAHDLLLATVERR